MLSSTQAGITIIDGLIGEKLADYMREKSGAAAVAVYRDAALIQGAVTSDVFLVDAEVLDEALLPLLNGRIFALCTKAAEKYHFEERIMPILRFAPADELLGEVFTVLLKENITIAGMKNPLLKCNMTAFFSPHGYEYLSLIAQHFCAISAESRRTLLLNLCPYAVRQETSGYDMGDLLYYLRTESLPLSQILEACMRECDGYYYIPPFREPRDMEDMAAEDIGSLIHRLIAESGCEVIVMVLPDRPFGIDAIFDNCRRFYLVSRVGEIYEQMEKRFADSLRADAEQREKLYRLEITDALHEHMASGQTQELDAYIIRNKGGAE